MKVAHRLVAGSLLGVALALVGPALPGPAAAGAAPVLIQTAWWWVPQADPPPGTVVPGGGLLVQGQPAGAVAEAALLATVGSTRDPALRLPLDGRSVALQDGRILACAAESPWQAGSSQQWSSRPRTDCSKAVAGSVSPDGTTVTFQVGSLVRNGELDIVLLPGTTPSLPPSADGSTFSAVFDPPSASVLTSSGPVPAGIPGPATGTSAGGPAPQANGPSSAPQPEAPVPDWTTGAGPVEPVPPAGSAGAASATAQAAGTSTGPTASPAPVAAVGTSSAQPSVPTASGPPRVVAGTDGSRRTRWLLTLGVLAAGLAVWRLPSSRAPTITVRGRARRRREKA